METEQERGVVDGGHGDPGLVSALEGDTIEPHDHAKKREQVGALDTLSREYWLFVVETTREENQEGEGVEPIERGGSGRACSHGEVTIAP